MKKKILTFVLAVCLLIPCASLLTACGPCAHEAASLQTAPTVDDTGFIRCWDCHSNIELPALNETDYVADTSNPDYQTYTCTVGKNTYKFTETNFGIVRNADETYTICAYFGDTENIVIPEIMGRLSNGDSGVFEEFPVAKIDIPYADTPTLSGNTNIISITLPSSLKHVERTAFSGCTNLKKIVVGSPTLIVGRGAFSNCPNLEEVYYKGDKEQWEEQVAIQENNEIFTNATRYYYSETKPTAKEYLDNDCSLNIWHYDANNQAVLWELSTTNYADGKAFTYSQTEVSVTDTYWTALKEMEAQGLLEDFFAGELNAQAEIDMVVNSSTKAEYETNVKNYYESQSALYSSISFANGKATIVMSDGSADLEYIEIEGEIIYTLLKQKAFTYDTTSNAIYEEFVVENFYTIKHIYTIVE